MDPQTMSLLLNLVPARYVLPVALVIIGCKIAIAAWKPPAAESRWAIVWRIVSTIALNIGWAVNKAQPGVGGVSVPLAQLPTLKAIVAEAPNLTRLRLPSVPLAHPAPVSDPQAGPGSHVNVPPAF